MSNVLDLNKNLLPSERCIFCNKKIEEIGGYRIVAQKSKGISLIQGTDCKVRKDHSKKIRLGDKTDCYAVVWGKDVWDESALRAVEKEFMNGHHPWFCQTCGDRKCAKCGFPLNYPMVSDVIHSDGRIAHCAIFPFNPGCCNPECECTALGILEKER